MCVRRQVVQLRAQYPHMASICLDFRPAAHQYDFDMLLRFQQCTEGEPAPSHPPKVQHSGQSEGGCGCLGNGRLVPAALVHVHRHPPPPATHPPPARPLCLGVPSTGETQQFRFARTTDGAYAVELRGHGLCLAAASYLLSNGVLMEMRVRGGAGACVQHMHLRAVW